MPRYDDNSLDSISVMEEIDPEPEERPGASRMKEFVLGLLLIIGVLAWALGTWWHDERVRSDYEKAQQAASAHRWDTALSHFTAAKGYMDSDARAAEAAKLIEERDKQYGIAAVHQQSGPAALALKAARAVQTIQPGYKDIDAIVLKAKEQALTDALLDTVVMRSQATPPGLYYRGAKGWIYLRDSDKWSTVLGGTAGEHILYDVPGPNWRPQAIPTPNDPARATGQEDKVGRLIIAATLNSDHTEVKYETLHLNPADYYFIIGDKGVWGLRYELTGAYLEIPKGNFNGLVRADYEAFGSGITSTVALKGENGVIADLGQRGSLALLAAYGAAQGDQQTTELYATAPDGSNPRTIFTTTGVVISAQLSPDEQHALVIASEPNDPVKNSRIVVTANLIDLAGTRPPVALTQITLPSQYGYGNLRLGLAERFSVSGVFLEKGAFKGKLLLGWLEGDLVKVNLLDISTSNPSAMHKTLAETTFPATRRIHPAITAVEQPEGKTLILYQQSQALERGSKGALLTPMKVIRAVVDAPAGASEMTVTESSIRSPGFEEAVRSDRAPYLGGPLLRSNWLVYTIYGVVNTDTWQQIYKVYSLPLADIGKESVAPMQILDSTKHLRPKDERWSGFVAGPNALAYVDAAGTLHARLYGADVDVVLEEGIDFMFPLYMSYLYKSLR